MGVCVAGPHRDRLACQRQRFLVLPEHAVDGGQVVERHGLARVEQDGFLQEPDGQLRVAERRVDDAEVVDGVGGVRFHGHGGPGLLQGLLAAPEVLQHEGVVVADPHAARGLGHGVLPQLQRVGPELVALMTAEPPERGERHGHAERPPLRMACAQPTCAPEQQVHQGERQEERREIGAVLEDQVEGHERPLGQLQQVEAEDAEGEQRPPLPEPDREGDQGGVERGGRQRGQRDERRGRDRKVVVDHQPRRQWQQEEVEVAQHDAALRHEPLRDAERLGRDPVRAHRVAGGDEHGGLADRDEPEEYPTRAGARTALLPRQEPEGQDRDQGGEQRGFLAGKGAEQRRGGQRVVPWAPGEAAAEEEEERRQREQCVQRRHALHDGGDPAGQKRVQGPDGCRAQGGRPGLP